MILIVVIYNDLTPTNHGLRDFPIHLYFLLADDCLGFYYSRFDPLLVPSNQILKLCKVCVEILSLFFGDGRIILFPSVYDRFADHADIGKVGSC